MNKLLPLKHIAVAGLGAVLLTAGASAKADPPARVARLAYINGPVSFAPAGENTWEYAAANRPLIPGDRLWVEAGARDEVQVGGAALRMGGNTLVTLLNLDDRTTQLQLSQGRLNVRVRRLRPNDVFEIDTPNLALSIRQPGDYRIEVDPSGNATMVAVRRGQAEAYGDGNAYRLGSGQAFSFGGTDLRDARYARPDLDDDFDRWSASRDRRIERARSVRYVSPELVGYEDLDDQGSWSVVPSYGNVWMPAHVGRDWAPYRDGHWTYVQPWGWTWVDDAPWGFAVSHYGRWARFPQGWGWVPGPRAASPVYAPALVAFISIGSESYAPRERPVAWFPLAPREVYRPSYRASPTYITNINVTNTTLIRNEIPRDSYGVDYVNRRVGGAVTAVPATAFVHSQPVSRAALAVPVAALAAAAITHNAPVSPERDSMRGHGDPGHQPPPAVMARQVLAKNAPPPELRHAPMPDMRAHGQGNMAQQGAPVAGPAPRMLPQDRHAGGGPLRDVPDVGQPPVANAPDTRAMQGMRPGAPQAGMPMPSQPNDERFSRQRDRDMNHGQRGEKQAPAPMPAPLAHAPMPMPAAVAAQPQELRGHGHDRMPPPPPQANVPAPLPMPAAVLAQPQELRGHGHDRMPPPQANVPVPLAAEQQRNQQQAEAQQRQRQQAAEQQHSQQQAEAQQRQRQQAAEQQRDQQAEAQQRQRQQAAEQQHSQQQAEAQQRQRQQAAEQQRDQQAQAQQRQRQQAAEQQHSRQQAEAQQRQRQQAAEQQHSQQQAEAQQRQRQQQEEQQRTQQREQQQAAAAQQRVQQQQAAEQQRAQQQAAAAQQQAQQQQAAAQQQRAQQQAAEQRRAERPQRHDAPAPAPQPAPSAAQPAQASQPAPASQQGNADEKKKEGKHRRDHPEQN